jgi:hypothetical protein
MARSESDREDLLREATALVQRAEFKLPGSPESNVVGFRRDGAASCFFGAGEVYQFNAAGELRRAYVANRLIKAERGRLVALTRERSASEVALVRAELSDAEQAALLSTAQQRLDGLQAALLAGEFELLGQVPAAADVLDQIRRWLAARSAAIQVAAVAGVR